MVFVMYSVGTTVLWRQGDQFDAGTVREIFMRRVTRTLAERRITREANPGNPVYLVERAADGDELLKSHAEIRPTGRTPYPDRLSRR